MCAHGTAARPSTSPTSPVMNFILQASFFEGRVVVGPRLVERARELTRRILGARARVVFFFFFSYVMSITNVIEITLVVPSVRVQLQLSMANLGRSPLPVVSLGCRTKTRVTSCSVVTKIRRRHRCALPATTLPAAGPRNRWCTGAGRCVSHRYYWQRRSGGPPITRGHGHVVGRYGRHGRR